MSCGGSFLRTTRLCCIKYDVNSRFVDDPIELVIDDEFFPIGYLEHEFTNVVVINLVFKVEVSTIPKAMSDKTHFSSYPNSFGTPLLRSS